LVAGFLVLAGCQGPSDTLPREAISGTVTLDGKPLPAGRIEFQPSGQAETTAASGGITDGSYRIRQDEGPVPGTYKVSVTSAVTTAKPPPGAMPGDTPPPPKEPIPAKFNAQTKLTAEVKKGGPNTFNFELTSK